MFIFVDMFHDRLQETDPTTWQRTRTDVLRTKYRLEELSGKPCLIVRYMRMTPELVQQLNPQAIVVSGHVTSIDYYAPEHLTGLHALLQQPPRPTLGICGGLHLMMAACNTLVAPMTEGVPTADPSDGVAWEKGFTNVSFVGQHPLLEGLGPTGSFHQNHWWEVKETPPGFINLAESPVCARQFLIHETLPLYGTQFHPELYDDAHPDGRQLLANFVRLASA